MAQIPVLSWIFQGIPECIILVFCTTKILGNKFATDKRKMLIGLGIVQAILTYIFRLLPLNFGIHSILSIIFLSLWTYLLTKKRPPLCILSSATCVLFLSAFEYLVFQVFINILGFQPEFIFTHIWFRIAVGWPQIIILLSIGILAEKIYQAREKKTPVNI